jgi:hypothetical protein
MTYPVAPVVSAVPTPVPQRSDPSNFAARGDATLTALPTTVATMNDLAAWMNGLASGVSTAAALAGFKGLWTSLPPSPLALPAAVYHAGRVWLLLNALANPTLSEPGVTTDWVEHSPQTGDNLLINPDFAVQQYVGIDSTPTTSSGRYEIDRWYSILKTDGTKNVRAWVADSPSKIKQAVVSTTNGGRIGLGQIVPAEIAGAVRGQRCSFSVEVGGAGISGATVRAAVLTLAPAADVVDKAVVNNWDSLSFTSGAFFKSGVRVAWTGSVTVTGTSHQLGGVDFELLPTSGFGSDHKNVIVMVWLQADPSSGAFLYVSKPDLYVGRAQRAFTPPADDRARCWYYYQAVSLLSDSQAFPAHGYVAQATQFRALHNLRVPMRYRPVMTHSGGAMQVVLGNAFTSAVTVVGGASPEQSSAEVVVFDVTSSGMTVGQAGYLRRNSSISGSPRFEFNAEL